MINKIMIETELKLQIGLVEAFRGKVLTIGKEVEERTHELTVMYDNQQTLMQITDGRLRVRTKTNSKGSLIVLSYKKPLNREGIKQEIEHETHVEDKESLERILENIGFFPVSSYERYRTNFLVEDHDQSALVSLDELPFGNYVEIEGNDIDFIQQVAISLGLNPQDHLENSYDGIYNALEFAKGNNPNPHIKFSI